ncbi:peptide chain release factor N(5)-glutamine methyltransferase [Endothiovibrio diazotrophicus]
MSKKTTTIADALARARDELKASDSAELDAQLLLCHVLGKGRSHLYTWPEREVGGDALAAFRALVARRKAGEPVAHLTGRRGFWSLELEVSPATLIPRPETELLVELALARLPAETASVADLGTGSGAIALALATERPRWRIVAVERSREALAVARRNGERLGLGNVEFLAGNWFEPLAGRNFDLVVSNPPYVEEGDPHITRGDVRFEPLTALTAGADGLDDLRHIVAGARDHLEPGGWLLLEHGYDQGEAVAGLLRVHGYRKITTYRDPAGHPRATLGQYGQP